jgi:hypothetical protein
MCRWRGEGDRREKAGVSILYLSFCIILLTIILPLVMLAVQFPSLVSKFTQLNIFWINHITLHLAIGVKEGRGMVSFVKS